MDYLSVGSENLEVETVVNKSRFISQCHHVESAEQAKEILLQLKKKHPFSTHICYAFITRFLSKFSDDGEPKDSAGKPILELMKNRLFCNTMITVIRYFGGIKLGCGGLARAYSLSAQKACENACLKPVFFAKNFRVLVGYNTFSFLENFFKNNCDARIISADFSDEVTVDFCIKISACDLVLNALSTSALGGLEIREMGESEQVFL